MRIYPIIAAAMVLCTMVCCKPKQAATTNNSTKAVTIGNQLYFQQQTLVYQTKADYSKNVPITLSTDGSKVVSYPAPTDVFYNGQLAYPTPLAKGYLLDNRGLTLNTAFISLTYEQYSKLKEAPTLDELYKLVIDKDPIVSLYNLGSRKDLDIDKINTIIKKGELDKYQKLR